MPPINDQNKGSGATAHEPAEIISPIKVRSTRQGDAGSLRRWIGPAALLVCLVSVLTAGGWLIWYLHKIPVSVSRQTEKEITARHQSEDNTTNTQDTAVTTPAPSAEGEASKVAASESPGDVHQEEISKKVLSLMTTGQKFEDQKDYANALAAYQQAYEMDPNDEEAGIAAKRVSDQIREVKYRQALTSGLDALEKKDYDQARQYLLKARSIKPGAREANAALAGLNQTLRRNRITSLKQKGQEAEAAENWQAAQKQYKAILAIDAENDFARQGLDRAQNQMRIMADIRGFIDRPGRLMQKSSLEKARPFSKKRSHSGPEDLDWTSL